MMRSLVASARVARAAVPALSLAFAASCAAPQLNQEPWSAWDAGTHTIGASTGWAIYEAEVEQTQTPPGSSSKETVDLEPQWGAALKYQYLFTDHFAVGLIAEARSFEPDELSTPSGAPVDPDAYISYHFILTSRYYFDGLGSSKRWRPYIGLDLGYIPEIEIDVTIGPLPESTLEGDEYWTIAPLVGMQYLITDRWSLDLGAFYEFPLDTTDSSSTVGPSTLDAEISPEGLIGFIGVGYAL